MEQFRHIMIPWTKEYPFGRVSTIMREHPAYALFYLEGIGVLFRANILYGSSLADEFAIPSPLENTEAESG